MKGGQINPVRVFFDEVVKLKEKLTNAKDLNENEIREYVQSLSNIISQISEEKELNPIRFEQLEEKVKLEDGQLKNEIKAAVAAAVKANKGKMIVEVSKKEWKIANRHFEKPGIFKLDKKTNSALNHSFVKFDNVIYAIDPGKVISQADINIIFGSGDPNVMAPDKDIKFFKNLNILGKGGMKVVKTLQNQGGEIKALMIEVRTTATKSKPKLEEEDEAIKIMEELGFLKGKAERESKRYSVADLYEGKNLEEFLRGHKDKLSQTQRFVMALKACQAIYALHKKGILHRDIKARNFMRDKDGNIKAIDLDTTLRYQIEGKPRKGTYFGTKAYMAPEISKADKDLHLSLYESELAEIEPTAQEAFFKAAEEEAKEKGIPFDSDIAEDNYLHRPPDEVRWYKKLIEVVEEYATNHPDTEKKSEYSTRSDVFALGIMLEYDIKIPMDNHIFQKMLAPNPEDRPTLSEVLKALVEILEKQPEYQTDAGVKAAALESKVDYLPGEENKTRSPSITRVRDMQRAQSPEEKAKQAPLLVHNETHIKVEKPK